MENNNDNYDDRKILLVGNNIYFYFTSDPFLEKEIKEIYTIRFNTELNRYFFPAKRANALLARIFGNRNGFWIDPRIIRLSFDHNYSFPTTNLNTSNKYSEEIDSNNKLEYLIFQKIGYPPKLELYGVDVFKMNEIDIKHYFCWCNIFSVIS